MLQVTHIHLKQFPNRDSVRVRTRLDALAIVITVLVIVPKNGDDERGEELVLVRNLLVTSLTKDEGITPLLERVMHRPTPHALTTSPAFDNPILDPTRPKDDNSLLIWSASCGESQAFGKCGVGLLVDKLPSFVDVIYVQRGAILFEVGDELGEVGDTRWESRVVRVDIVRDIVIPGEREIRGNVGCLVEGVVPGDEGAEEDEEGGRYEVVEMVGRDTEHDKIRAGSAVR